MSTTPQDDPQLHLYGQSQWHDEAYLVGNTAGLTALWNAINGALGKGTAAFSASVNDDEGYCVCVVKVDNPQDFDRLAVPYHEEMAKEKQDDKVHPAQIQRVRDAVIKATRPPA